MHDVDFFISVGLGLGGTDAPQVRSRKSMSNERTFSATKDETFFHQKLGRRKYLLNLIFISKKKLQKFGSSFMSFMQGLYLKNLDLDKPFDCSVLPC